MMDTLITFTQSGLGQTIGLIGFLLFPLFAAIYGTVLKDSENRSFVFESLIFIVFFASCLIFAVDEYSILKTIGRGFVYIFITVMMTGLCIHFMESK